MKPKIRYLKQRKESGEYRYCRDLPTKLRETFPELPQQFSKELKLREGCDYSQLLKAMEEASRLYDLRIKMISNSDPEAFTESELKMAVEEVLSRRKLTKGQFVHVPESQYKTSEQFYAAVDAGEVLLNRSDHAWEAFPEIDDIIDDAKRSKKLTFKQEVLGDAWKAVQELPKVKQRQTMREAWNKYLADNNIDVTSNSGKKKQQKFDRILPHTGDFVISNETRDDVQDRIQRYITGKREQNPKIKAQSLKRELAEFIAAIKHVPRIDWGDRLRLTGKQNNFQIPIETAPIQGKSLNDDELRLFFHTCITKADAMWTALLLAAHAGVSSIEIRRLRADKDLYLDAKYPHIIFRGGDEGIAKTDARPRVVPIVLGLEVIKKWLPQTIKWMNSVNQNTPSATLNKRLRTLLGQEPTIKMHMFRHTWLRLARRARISEDNKHAIAGWEHGDKNNTVMERVYDTQGYKDDPELLRQLHEDQQEIFSRFIVDQAAVENVVELKR